jgi:dihydroorotase-like cyclic amidohydrolase
MPGGDAVQRPHTVDNPAVMRRAMTYARDFGAVVAMATQDRHLGRAGVMNEGLFASWLGLPGIPAKPRSFRSNAICGWRR